jgi:hypothetical protein
MDEDKPNKLYKVMAYVGIIGTAVGKTLMFCLFYLVAISILMRNIPIQMKSITMLHLLAYIGAIGTYVYEYMIGKKRLEA